MDRTDRTDRTETTALLERAREGSDEALNRVLEHCAAPLLRYIRLRLGPSLRARLESGDILNASLLKAFRNLDGFGREDGRSLRAWLARIADNEIRDQADFHGRERRDAARAVRLDSAAEERLAARLRTQTERLALRERLDELERALDSLEPAQREVILLRKFEERGFAEIGRSMDRSPDACRMLLARAMAALTLRMRRGRMGPMKDET
jgi:RNA polymerase sigma-70 factor (ECF subfamily)